MFLGLLYIFGLEQTLYKKEKWFSILLRFLACASQWKQVNVAKVSTFSDGHPVINEKMGGFKLPWVKKRRLRPEGLSCVVWRWRGASGTAGEVAAATWDHFPTIRHTSYLTHRPAAAWRFFTLACISERSPSLNNHNVDQGKTVMKVEEAAQNGFSPKGRNAAPIRNKTQRITWVRFIRCDQGSEHVGMSVRPLSVLRSSVGPMQQSRKRSSREERALRGSDERVLCGGQVADCWSWEMKAGRRPLIYCTVHRCRRWIAPVSFYFSVFFSSVPDSEWCIGVRRGWASGGIRAAGAHSDTWGGQGKIWRNKWCKTRQKFSTKICGAAVYCTLLPLKGY